MINKYTPTSHQDWLDHRVKTIGGSEVATIVGINPYSTPLQLYHRKQNELKGIFEEEQNEATLMGHLLENAVAQRWEIATEKTVIQASAKEVIYYNDDYPHAHYSPDRIFWRDPNGKKNDANKALLECKTTMKNVDLSDFDDPTVLMWFTQLQWGLGILGMTHGSLAVLRLNNRSFVTADFYFAPNYFKMCYDKVKAFMENNLFANVEPECTTADDVLVRYPDTDPDTIAQADDEVLATFNALSVLKEQQKELDEKIAPLEDKLKVAFLDKEKLFYGNRPLATWKKSADGTTFDKDRFMADHPDLYEKYQKTKAGSRRLILKKQSE